MQMKRRMRAPLAAVSGLLALLVVAPIASANHINNTSSSASCTLVNNVPTLTASVKFEAFGNSNKPVSGSISDNGTVVKTYSGSSAITWPSGQSSYTLVFTSASTAGSHRLVGTFTWPGKTSGDNGTFDKTVTCPAPVVHPGIEVVKDGPATAVVGDTATYTFAVTNTGDVKLDGPSVADDKCAPVTKVADGDTSFDPGDVWHYTCSMTITDQMGSSLVNTVTACGTGQAPLNPCDTDTHTTTITPATTPPVTPPQTLPPGGGTSTPPGGGVLPESILSGQARLRGPSGCVKQAFRARVTGRSIASVAFYLDGKLVKRYGSARSRYTIKLSPRRYGFGRHQVVAKVTFLARTGTQARTIRLTFRRCAQGAVAPRFTG